MIMLKVTKNQGFILSLEDTFFEKPQGGVKGLKMMKKVFHFILKALFVLEIFVFLS